jgi:hypothetical protein
MDLLKQDQFYTPHGTITPVTDELSAQTLKFELWMSTQELEAIGEIEKVCLIGIKPPNIHDRR